ncbi:MAG: beta-galactosidase, partial [Anaerolineae bacterium]|nr:beta-galactosidase [Anaerolineae bacterium]
LITTFFSGIVDGNDPIRLGGYPAPFREMLGLMVEEYVPFPQGLTNTIQTMAGDEILVSLWADVIRTEGAETLARFGSDYFAGGAAVTSNIFGKGRGVYVGTELPALGKDWLLETACRDVGVTPAMELPVGVEFTCRTSGSKTWQFFLNHSGSRAVIPIKQRGIDLLSGKPVNTFIELDVNGAVVIELE